MSGRPAPGAILWGRSIAWLLLLGPLFFASYGFANKLAARRGVGTEIAFAWEAHIPFLPWTILPYWSIDLLYGLSFLLCRSQAAVDRHALRLLSAQILSVACFIAFPLRFGPVRPALEGPSAALFGGLFEALGSFDLPYNQAPALHISLLLILWMRYAAASRGPWRVGVDLWALLIGISVLTTWQHHFIDIPSGALAGLLCLWLWPEEGEPPLAHLRLTRHPARRRIAAAYLGGALALGSGACAIGGAGLWLLWGSGALALVALIYAITGSAGFQKHAGRHSLAAGVLLAPYMAAAWLNSRWWTRHHPAAVEISDGVWLGRLPSAGEMRAGGFTALVDLCAELPAPRGPWQYTGLPWLDLVTPDSTQLAAAADAIEAARRHGPLRVSCALGFSRSACAVAAWLLASGRAADVDAAIALIRQRRPAIVLGPGHRAALATLAQAGNHG